MDMQPPDHQNPDRIRPQRPVFIGASCLWPRPLLPPDIASVDPIFTPKIDSGGDAVVVPDRSTTSGHAADIARLEPGDDFLRSGLEDRGSPSGDDSPWTGAVSRC